MQKILTQDLPNVQATERFAQGLANILNPPLVIGFSGEIGVGKTTLIRAMLKALGVTAKIKSPSYSLIESYNINYHASQFKVHHFDFYRIKDENELEYIGIRDFFTHDAICCIEWPEHASDYLAKLDIYCIMKIINNRRQIEILANSTYNENNKNNLLNISF